VKEVDEQYILQVCVHFVEVDEENVFDELDRNVDILFASELVGEDAKALVRPKSLDLPLLGNHHGRAEQHA